MAFNKILNLVAISSLAVFVCTFAATPANALSTGTQHMNRHIAHDGIVKRKRDASSSKRCKPRSTTSAAASTTPAKSSSSTTHAPTHTSSTKAAPPPPPKTSSKAPAPPPAASPAPAPAPPSGGSGSGKVGIAWNNGPAGSLQYYKTDKTHFLYSWSSWKPDGADELGFDFMPMLWGESDVSDFEANVKPGYGTHILGFNEPEIAGQSSLDPGTAASLWKQYIEPKKSMGYTLVSPALTSDSNAKPWYQSFLSQCTGCTIDVCALHWYGLEASDMITYVTDWHNTFGCDIFLTEYAVENFVGSNQADAAQIEAFHQTSDPWLDSTPWILGYFAFGTLTNLQNVNPLNALMDPSTGKPTSLGEQYINDSW